VWRPMDRRAYRQARRRAGLETYASLGTEQKARAIARGKLNLAVLKRQVKRQPCERCGATPAEAHHEDYSKPLDVQWLCNTHHKEADAEKRRLDEGDTMRRIKPKEVAQAQRFSTGIERVGEDLIERYREVEAQNVDRCVRSSAVAERRQRVRDSNARFAARSAALDDRLDARLSGKLGADMRSEIDRAFDLALGEGQV
jgi:hypothetical protein